MGKILITGATGNVGMEVIKALTNLNHDYLVYSGVRNVQADDQNLESFNAQHIHFDFTNSDTFQPALTGIDILFLLRPPQISEVQKYFKPLIEAAIKKGVKHIVFLSVQGVQHSKIIPHHKIEKLIVENNIDYTFLRPAYFMQNFTTTLRHDLKTKNKIYLPAGKAKFTLVDVSDIGEVAAKVLTETFKHKNQCYELTCNEKLTFTEIALKLSKGLGKTIKYESPALLSFFITKKKEKMPTMLILVMIMLHYFPRFQKEPDTTDCIANILNKQPKEFDQFIFENKHNLC
ncbi:MAG: NmrA family NAD(P)-binding protein [Ferruginibacter sp.]